MNRAPGRLPLMIMLVGRMWFCLMVFLDALITPMGPRSENSSAASGEKKKTSFFSEMHRTLNSLILG